MEANNFGICVAQTPIELVENVTMCQIHWILASIGQMYYMYNFQLYYCSSWNLSNLRQCCWPSKLNMFK